MTGLATTEAAVLGYIPWRLNRQWFQHRCNLWDRDWWRQREVSRRWATSSHDHRRTDDGMSSHNLQSTHSLK